MQGNGRGSAVIGQGPGMDRAGQDLAGEAHAQLAAEAGHGRRDVALASGRPLDDAGADDAGRLPA